MRPTQAWWTTRSTYISTDQKTVGRRASPGSGPKSHHQLRVCHCDGRPSMVTLDRWRPMKLLLVKYLHARSCNAKRCVIYCHNEERWDAKYAVVCKNPRQARLITISGSSIPSLFPLLGQESRSSLQIYFRSQHRCEHYAQRKLYTLYTFKYRYSQSPVPSSKDRDLVIIKQNLPKTKA